MNPKRHRILALATFLALGAALPAAYTASPYRVPVHFAYTNDAGVGNSWFVIGSHYDVGYQPAIGDKSDYWDVLRAVPLAWHNGNVWSADIGIQAGTELKYKFIKRPTNASDFPDGSKVEWMAGSDLEFSVPAEPPAPAPGKRVVLLCDWDEPVEIWYSMLSKPDYEATNGWNVTTMKKTGEGRYELDNVGEAGEWMRFTFRHPREEEPDWWYHFYQTEEDFWSPLDAFCIRDGQVFNYEPAVKADGYVSDSRIEDRYIGSTNAKIAERGIRIYLPRGYDENTGRRYPVVYLADGQNMFSDDPGAAMGGWKADTAADREIRGGRMREAILVGVPCRTEDIPGMPGTAEYARLWEYLPGTDNLNGIAELRGLADDYADFLLGNVRPTLNTHYRTLTDRDNTAHVGSSAGGLLSFYFGVRYTNDFGLVGALSGVYNDTYIPNLRNWCGANLASVASPKRIWLDTGTEETAVGNDETKLNLYESNWEALTLLLYAGHVHNKSLHFGVYSGWQGEHNEPAWAERIDEVFDFLLPVTDETNPLLLRSPEIGLDGLTMQIPGYPGFTYTVKRADSVMDLLKPSAATVRTTNIVDRPWGIATCPATEPGFYWVECK